MRNLILQTTSVAGDLFHLRSDDRKMIQINLRDALAILQRTLFIADLFHLRNPGTATLHRMSGAQRKDIPRGTNNS